MARCGQPWLIEPARDGENSGSAHANRRRSVATLQGTEKIAYHEQRDVLKPMYERHSGVWAKLSSDGYAYRANGIGIQEFPSPVDGGVTFHDFMPKDSNIANFDDRWKWTQQSIIPEWRKQEINPSPVLNSMYARDILLRADDK